jgi:DNA-binding transcriptional LysR family regulator
MLSGVPVFTDLHAHVAQSAAIPDQLSRLGIDARREVELNSFEVATKLAADGLGLVALPDRNAARAVRAGSLRPVALADAPPDLLRYEICATTRADESDQDVASLLSELKASPAFA